MTGEKAAQREFSFAYIWPYGPLVIVHVGLTTELQDVTEALRNPNPTLPCTLSQNPKPKS